jgi:3-deoxy-manno-octulosonate cytidylyltransferase (CMP-KDO synthetase)
MQSQIVIPARLASTRLPEKLLRRAGGKSVLQHTYESASRSKLSESLVVAVDDPRLADEVASFGGKAIMTSRECASGTDRIAEVAARFSDVDVFVNVQGDEPEIDPAAIDLVIKTLLNHSDASIATVATPIRDSRLLNDPSCVKIVMGGMIDGCGRAIYFSRAAVPMDRDANVDNLLAEDPPIYWHHIGLYAYRREFLQWFSDQPPSRLEQVERLEQLRAIEAGKTVVVARVESAMPGIDTKEDLDRFTSRIES